MIGEPLFFATLLSDVGFFFVFGEQERSWDQGICMVSEFGLLFLVEDIDCSSIHGHFHVFVFLAAISRLVADYRMRQKHTEKHHSLILFLRRPCSSSFLSWLFKRITIQYAGLLGLRADMTQICRVKNQQCVGMKSIPYI